jgi:hypothetical protein
MGGKPDRRKVESTAGKGRIGLESRGHRQCAANWMPHFFVKPGRID